MRRLVRSFSVVALLGAFVGCHHTAGQCDCDHVPGVIRPGAPLSGAPLPATGGAIIPGKPVEPIKQMPKEVEPRKPGLDDEAAVTPTPPTPPTDN
jgi:hypothetical protein